MATETSFRDLGGHLNLGSALSGATVNGRLATATDYAIKICRMPWSYSDKAKVVQGLVLPKGFYGAEAAPPAISAATAVNPVASNFIKSSDSSTNGKQTQTPSPLVSCLPLMLLPLSRILPV